MNLHTNTKSLEMINHKAIMKRAISGKRKRKKKDEYIKMKS